MSIDFHVQETSNFSPTLLNYGASGVLLRRIYGNLAVPGVLKGEVYFFGSAGS